MKLLFGDCIGLVYEEDFGLEHIFFDSVGTSYDHPKEHSKMERVMRMMKEEVI